MAPIATLAPERERTVRVEECGRITPRMVLEAYETTGLTPKRMLFQSGDTACAVGALAASEGVYPNTSEFVVYNERLNARRGGAYMSGFYQGFDGVLDISGSHNTTYRQGYHDGRRVARFVFPTNGGV